MPFWQFFVVVMLMFYCVYGLASIVSMLTRRENASLLAVVVCMTAGIFNGFGPTLEDARKVRPSKTVREEITL